MSVSQEQGRFAQHVALLLQYIAKKGLYCSLGEAYRTPEQAELYAKEGKGIVDSLHCKRLAIDLNLYNLRGQYLSDYQDYEPFGVYWESLDPINRWGGFFVSKYGGHIVDSDHFERNA